MAPATVHPRPGSAGQRNAAFVAVRQQLPSFVSRCYTSCYTSRSRTSDAVSDRDLSRRATPAPFSPQSELITERLPHASVSSTAELERASYTRRASYRGNAKHGGDFTRELS